MPNCVSARSFEARTAVFACASLNPAKAVGEAERIGSLEVEKCADIMICDDNINVITTIIDGNIFE